MATMALDTTASRFKATIRTPLGRLNPKSTNLGEILQDQLILEMKFLNLKSIPEKKVTYR